jgi:hypothetical protein
MLCFVKPFFFTIFLFILYSNVQSQNANEIQLNHKDSLRKASMKMAISDLFYNKNCDGLYYLGLSNSFEINSYYIGGEFKLYDSYYTPFLGFSIFTNFRTQIVSFSELNNLNAFSIGGNISILGIEMTTYFKKNEFYNFLTPKIGFDYGSWSVFYGFSFPNHNSHIQGISRHSLSVKYYLYLSTIKYYKMRKKS